MAHLVTVERELLSVRHVELQAEAGWRWRIERAFKSQPGPWGCSSWTRQSVWQWSTQPTHPISRLKVKSPRGYLAEVGKIVPSGIAAHPYSRVYLFPGKYERATVYSMEPAPGLPISLSPFMSHLHFCGHLMDWILRWSWPFEHLTLLLHQNFLNP